MTCTYIIQHLYSGKNIGNRLHINLKKYHKGLELSLVLMCNGVQLKNMHDFEFSSKKQQNSFIVKVVSFCKNLGSSEA